MSLHLTDLVSMRKIKRATEEVQKSKEISILLGLIDNSKKSLTHFGLEIKVFKDGLELEP